MANLFWEKVRESQDIIIFGYTEIGQVLFEKIRDEYTNKMICFCDSNPEKCIVTPNYEVISPREAVSKHSNAVFILTSYYYREDMREQLKVLGVAEDQILTEFPEDIKLQHVEIMQARHSKKMERFHFDVDISRHCNLNCAGCAHFSPLSEKSFYNLSMYDHDVKRLGELFHHDASRIQILGGEPLLNPNVTEYCRIAREGFPSAEIVLLTNGILLKDMDNLFWQNCNRFDVVIAVTRYPINIDYEYIEDLVCRHNIRYKILGVYGAQLRKERCKFRLYAMDLNGLSDPKDNFLNCPMSNRCINLKNGRLYTCATIPCIDLFATFFNLNIFATDDDSIDIYGTDSADEILEFLARPVPFCRYCDIKKHIFRPFGISKKSIKEWTA